MSSPAAVLSILIEANSSSASKALAQYQGQLETANTHVSKVEESTGKFGKTVDGVAKPVNAAASSIGKLAKAALAAGAAFVSYEAAKNAIDTTLQLGEATEKLSAITGLDTKTTSTWIEAMKSRGVQSKQVSLSFITLSKNMRNAEEGSKTAKKAFDQLGVSQDYLRTHGTQDVLLKTADGLAKMKDPADRAAIAQQLFGRSAQALIPVLAQGSKGVKDLLGNAQKYGAYLPNNTKSTLGAIEAQRALGLAFDGLKISFTEAVLPVLVQGAQAFVGFIGQMRDGQGVGGKFASVISVAFNALKTAIAAVVVVVKAFIGQIEAGTGIGGTFANAVTSIWTALKGLAPVVVSVATWMRNLVTEFQDGNPLVVAAAGAVGGLVIAFTALKVATIAYEAALKIASVTQAAFNLVVEANPYVLAATAIIALVGALVALYTKVGVVRDFVNAAWTSIRTTAQTVFPIIAAVAVAAFNTIKTLITPIINAIVGVVKGGLQEIRGVIEVFSGFFSGDFGKMWDGIKDIFSGALHAVISLVRGEVDTMRAAGASLLDGLHDGINAGWGAVKDLVSNIADKIVSTITGVWNSMFDAGKYILGGVSSGFKSAVSAVLGVIVGFINDIVGVIDDIPGVNVGKVAVPKFAHGGMVNAPGYFAGEEAPRHPEVILATNPAYRKRNLALFEQAGHMLGVPGFAGGGIFGDLLNVVEAPVKAGASVLSGITNILPSPPSLPGWIAGLPGDLLSHAASFIKNKVTGIFDSGGGGGGGGPLGDAAAVAASLGSLGWNKIAIAGAIGNAVQESSVRPTAFEVPGDWSQGVGLWQWTPGTKLSSWAAARGLPWQSVMTQAMKLTADIGGGGVAAMNAQQTPAGAATWLEENFEHAGIISMGSRIAGANEAYKAGYRMGGMYMPPYGGSFATGGVVPGPAGSPRTIVAHGGEMVSNGHPVVEVHIHDGAIDRSKIEVISRQATRTDARLATRRLPGSR